MALPVDDAVDAVPMAHPIVPMAHPVEEPCPKATVIITPNAPTAIPNAAPRAQSPTSPSPTASQWVSENDSTGYTAIKKPVNKPKKPSGMNEVEEKLFNSGVALLFVPLIATVLPLVGLQLKILAVFGIIAPLIGILFGIVGAVMITFARHRIGDQVAMGAASAMLTISFGVVGGFIALVLNPDGINFGSGNYEHTRSVELGSVPPISLESSEAIRDRDSHLPGYRPPGSGPPNVGSGMPPTVAPLNPTTPGTGGLASVPPSDSSGIKKEDGPPETQFEVADGKKYPDNPALEVEQGKDESLELLVKMANAISTFRAQPDVPGANKKDIKVENLVGYETKSGLLYDDIHVKALCGFSPIGYFDIVPIELTESQFAHALRPKVGEVLIGLRFSFEKEQIVGVQGIFHGGEDDADRETIWIGKETDEKKASMIPESGPHGFVIFKNGPASVGFGWVPI